MRRSQVSFDAVPTYVYKFVETGETIEVQQSFADPTLTETAHPVTGVTMPVKKVFQPVGVTFRGDGFYKTDSRSSGKKSGGSTGESSSSSGDSSTSGTASDAGSKSDSAAGSSSTPSTTTSTSSSASSSSSSD